MKLKGDWSSTATTPKKIKENLNFFPRLKECKDEN